MCLFLNSNFSTLHLSNEIDIFNYQLLNQEWKKKTQITIIKTSCVQKLKVNKAFVKTENSNYAKKKTYFSINLWQEDCSA